MSLIATVALISGCSFLAQQTAPTKTAALTRSAAAVSADALFWQTLHSGDYDGISKAMIEVKAAYLETPGDAITAAHVGFLHIWRIAESARLKTPTPDITDDAVLAAKYFQEAVTLNPKEARYRGLLGASQLTEATIHGDEKLTRKGYYTLLDAIDGWPEFNLFTAGYVLSNQPKDSAQFKEALAWQWRTVDLCTGANVDRRNPNYAAYMALETQTGQKRVCWNSWIAPHNFEGFFMNMGDLLVKSGDWQTAQKVYANAKLSKTYGEWKFKAILDKRIAQAQANVAVFAETDRNKFSAENTLMTNTRFACVACHQN